MLTIYKIKLILKQLIKKIICFGEWGLGIGDWGLGIGDWAQSPIPNPQSPIPIWINKFQYIILIKINKQTLFIFYINTK